MTPSDKAPEVKTWFIEPKLGLIAKPGETRKWSGVEVVEISAYNAVREETLNLRDDMRDDLREDNDALAKRCAGLEAENRRLDLICEQEFGERDQLQSRLAECYKANEASLESEKFLREKLAKLRARIIQVNGFLHDANTWADRLEEALIAKCENMDYPNQVKQTLIEFKQWREKRGSTDIDRLIRALEKAVEQRNYYIHQNVSDREAKVWANDAEIAAILEGD